MLGRERQIILTFDSGLGGLTVQREIAAVRPDARYIYVADDAFFPYGRHGETALTARLVPLMGTLIAEYRPDIVVIACNTASTLVLPHLRAAYTVPFVGTVPAIKPACAASKTRMVSVLGTEATVAREYTRTLIRNFGQGCTVTLVGAAHLAAIAEAALRDEPVDQAVIAREAAPCFIGEGSTRTDTVVLACTHYPLLRERLEAASPWPVAWVDPAPAIARRVLNLLGPARTLPAGRLRKEGPPDRFVFTSGKHPTPALVTVLDRFGLHLTDGPRTEAALTEPAAATLPARAGRRR